MFTLQPSLAENIQKDLPAEVKKQAQERIDLGYHLGTVIGIIDRNGSRFYGFGHMSLTNKSRPTEHSLFEIASVTKTFTTALLADLELKNQINIEASIGTYLPVFKKTQSVSGKTINLESLVNHTSGLPRNPPNLDNNGNQRYKDYTVEDLNNFLTGFDLDSSPKKYAYSNLSYLVLEHVIETKMNTTYESLIEDRILEPLKMSNTHFRVPNEKRKKLVTGFKNGKHTDELNLGSFQSPGGLKTTAKDMLKYLGAQIGLISSPINEAMKITHKKRFSNDEITLGLGWKILERKESGKTILFHKGGTNGFVTFAGINLEDQIGVIVLVNGRDWFSDLGFKLLDPTYTIVKDLKPNN